MAPTSSSARPIVVSGPSGAGKSTILKRLFEKYPTEFGFSISHTTRAPRGQEQDGVEYHFVSRDDFDGMIERKDFIEHAQFGSNLYGTSVKAVRDVEHKGRVCVLDIEMEGVKQIRAHPQFRHTARFLFLSPPSPEMLEQRLRGRGTDNEDAIQKRLTQAKKEMEYANTPGVHDKIVVNDELDKAWREIEDWIFDDEGGLQGQKKP